MSELLGRNFLRALLHLGQRLRAHPDGHVSVTDALAAMERAVEVLLPALPFFPSHALWKRQFRGASGLFAFRLRGDVRRFADALRSFSLGFSWGGVESLVLPHALGHAAHPGSKVRADVPDDLIRISVGLEDPEDLWVDLQRGFDAQRGA